jgi:acyl dehydratase/NAD(P)-dependent dehydrogenase (short-subunit alcohol dehydrogenase family)
MLPLTESVAASRTFEPGDQKRFAELSGDFNPIHIDPIAARRTQPGAPVVHGIHALLWALDIIGARHNDILPVAKLNARFLKVVYPGERVDLVIAGRDARGLTAQLRVGGDIAVRLSISFSAGEEASKAALDITGPATPVTSEPLDLTIEQIASRRGRVAFAPPAEKIAGAFPAAHKMLGARRVAALGASTRLIGMVCPGLHSVYAGLSLVACDDADPAPGLAFSVTVAHSLLRVVRQTVSGGGFSGTVESFVRRAPVMQASMTSLAGLVHSHQFADSTGLVVGGSRGLGEATAKLVAAGGGRVIITYLSGKSDAVRVASEIAGWGGRAEIIRYDARLPPEQQLADLPAQVTHLYYFATPPIARRRAGAFDRRRFDEFVAYYVEGFYELCCFLTARVRKLSVYYPSSVYVEKWPNGLLEYAMAKAAGELLCTNLGTQANMQITATRLPPMATDQTTGLLPAETADAPTVLLPIVLKVQAAQ